ncbi:hypothetical protein BG015_002512 [Linnemannia schmuckeri]|uniref:Major facilitator superfamily (MFS) profile domain-containing protein n=1 Tax=Linnemannia schmuckeri TaxID=64567 RepID=A0A9P5S6K3_9FUNG|nr:hypothetical protein BG015_002512 [Linnemannia schmuckeri]
MSKTTTSLDLSQHPDDKTTLQHGHHQYCHHHNNSNNTLTNKDSDITLTGDRYNGATKTIEAGILDIEPASLSSDSLAKAAAAGDDMLADGPAYGWVVVFACFVYQMVSMGFCNSYGVFQNYYLTETFKDKATVFQITWIGTLAMTLLDALGPFTGAICDYFGHRSTTLIGVSVMTLSLVLAAFSTQVWQLYLTQGLLYGSGTSLTYFASMTLPSQWFTKNRGLVTGITISGGGIGGLWISPIVSRLLNTKGSKFTMLVIAATHLILLIPTGFLYRARQETGREKARRIRRLACCEGESVEAESKQGFVDFTILKDLRFCLLVVSCAFVISGYFSPFFFITSYAIQHNVDKSTAALMVGLMNGSAAIGRIVMGFILDRIGSINALCISTFATTLTLFFLWMFAKTSTLMIIFSVAYGLCGGAHVSSAISASSVLAGKLDRLGSVTGIMYAVMTIGSTVGSPVSGAILDTVGHHTDYTGVIVWSGSVMLIASLIQFVMKFVTNRDLFAKI